MIFIKDQKSAEETLKAEVGDVRSLQRHEHYIVATIAISWALFQLALAGFLVLDSTKVRAIHLAFGMALLFLLNPCIKNPKINLGFLSVKDRISVIDYVFAVVGALSALYLIFDYEGIAMRAGVPITRDLVAGIVLVILLLEAARRVIGPALSVIAILFTLYAFLGPHMPDILAFKGVSLRKYLSNIFLSTEGIYGIPLGVSASIVYLFVLLGALLEKAGRGDFLQTLPFQFLENIKGGQQSPLWSYSCKK